MSDLRKGMEVNCEWFLNELEGLPTGGPNGTAPEKLLGELPVAAREHAAKCTGCLGAVRDFAETREALGAMKEEMPEAGPWFTRRVMASINAQEAEIEEKTYGVWVSVRRFAPRLAAFAGLLLFLGGTWAVQVRRTEEARSVEIRRSENLFEAAPSAPPNDDIMLANAKQEPAR